MLLYICFFLLIFGCILTHSGLSLYYAFMGLELWYEKMIPTLVPFMILSGIMIRLGLTEGFVSFLYPLLKPVYRVSRNVCYAMFMGFLCGFPMGAKTVADLYARRMLTRREAEFLLAFCNNIGPVYFAGFVLPLLGRQLTAPYVAGMYGIPLLYGLTLRHTAYRDIALPPVTRSGKGQEVKAREEKRGIRLLNIVDDAILSSVHSIVSLGGYMIFFNLLNLLPHILLGRQPILLAPFLEISGGLQLLQRKAPLYTLLLLPFGGLSCIAQTNGCLKDTDLSMGSYLLHKLFLTLLTALYYLCWFLFFPVSFMR